VLKRERSLYLIVFLLSFCIGVALFSYWQIFVDKMVVLPVFFSLVALVLAKKWWRLCSCLVLGFTLGWAYLSLWGMPLFFQGEEVVGRVDEVVCSKQRCTCVIKSGGLRIKLVFSPERFDPSFCLPGNLVEAKGKSVPVYSSERFAKRISGAIKVSELKLIAENPPLFLAVKRKLYLIKESFKEQLKKVMSEGNRSFAQGLVLGEKQSFSSNFKEALKRTGTSHLVALSGFNISVLIFSLFETLKFLSPLFAFSTTCLAILVFVLMTGASASIVRAGIMGVFLLSAQILGRQRDSVLILSFSLFIMALLNPFSLVWDISLQLSFFAFVGLLALSPLLSPPLQKFGFLGGILAETIGAILFTLPLVAYYFGSISWIAFLVNVLVVAVVPLATYLILATAVFGFFSLFLSRVFSYLAEVFLFYILKIIEFFGRFSWAVLNLKISHFGWLFLYYLILGFLVFYLWQTRWQNEKLQP